MTEAFRYLLLEWYERVRRDLPWRRTSDAYAIWVSEIMLQQTRVAAVIPFYKRFLERFPDIRSLADASEQQLLAAWSGLGYYTRVRNMQRAAQVTSGAFPREHSAILSLPGIGEYTAAAIASIAFGLPHAAVDGNVMRVLTRVTNDTGDIGAGTTKKRIAALASSLLDRERPGEFNQAMMELGATVCLPRAPQCLVCPIQSLCEARRNGTQDRLPVKGSRAETLRVSRVVYIVKRKDTLLFWQRSADSAKMAGFWELPEPDHLIDPPTGTVLGRFQHSITNHDYAFEVRKAQSVRCRQGVAHAWLDEAVLGTFPVSTTAKKALQVYRSIR
jgi:A/G-specific adenine glycosylase